MKENSSNSLSELYKEVILDHNKNPRNYFKMKEFTNYHEGFNPICGDHVYVYLKVRKDNAGRGRQKTEIIEDISFYGVGCAISKSSASLMTECLKGKTVDSALKLFDSFNSLLKKDLNSGDEQILKNFGKLKVFSGIWQFPSRLKCANLCWHTMKAALMKTKEIVKTE